MAAAPGSNGSANGAADHNSRIDRLIDAIQRQHLRRELAGRVRARTGNPATTQMPIDCLIATGSEPHLPDDVFPRLRWGGAFVYVAPQAKHVKQLADAYDEKRGFSLVQKPTHIWHAPFGLRLPPLATKGHYFIARKTQLIQPGDFTERFTYHVDLVPAPEHAHGYLVRKQIPAADHVYWRLRKKYPDVSDDDLKRRTHKLIDHIFPTFLTREAAFLKLLQRDLPDAYRCRVPEAVHIEKDERGFVHTMYMNWLRNRSEPISQLEFARQSADLLAALHEQAGIMHLDLRLDNFVLTEDGVGFVDFGSAVRLDEQLERSDMLKTLFDQMMRTSQIQHMLGKMLERGEVTSENIRQVHGKVDRAVDSFYLAVQINQAHLHPELRHLVRFDAEGAASTQLQRLTAAVLRPKNPHKAHYKSAADILRGIQRIQRKLHEQQQQSGDGQGAATRGAVAEVA